jgi:4-methyl-5(b-hydroxyethyl)-thiazole monophosphate biosynthesis
MTKRVLVPIADGTEELEAVAIIDTLRRAGADVTVASVGKPQITASRSVKIVADVTISECVDKTYDLIVLPGGARGAELLRDNTSLTAMLQKQKQSARLYAAICAAPAVVLQHHGLLKNVRATCYPSLQDRLDKKYLSNDRVVVDGNCITGQGPGVAVEFALKLVELLFGIEKKKEVAVGMLVKV